MHVPGREEGGNAPQLRQGPPSQAPPSTSGVEVHDEPSRLGPMPANVPPPVVLVLTGGVTGQPVGI
jgi:hypothetical protein